MGCKFSDFEGKCQNFDEDNPIETPGCDDEGNCICEEDPDPSISCETYESEDE